jgi:gliding motility-associated-like protein
MGKKEVYTNYGGYKIIFLIALLLTTNSGLVRAQLSASFDLNRTEGCVPLIVVFDNTSTGNFQTCTWNFGNGNSSTECNPVATYTSPGDYIITLTISSGGQSSTFSRSVKVFASPVPEFDADIKGGCLPLQVRFTDLTPPTQAPLISWVWDFGDGRSSGQQNPQQTYLGENSYNVSLIVTDANGCRGSTTKNAFVTSTSTPVVNFSNSDTAACRIPFTVNFLSTSQSSYPLSYSWDFGNGSNSAGEQVQTAFSTAGTFNVQLTAVNNFGCGATLSRPITITLEEFTPVANFSALSGCAPLTVDFGATANLPISGAAWVFGNGQSSNALSGAVTFTNPGTYNIRGTFQNAQGCTETITQTIIVNPKPEALFDANPKEACAAPVTVQFTSQTPDAVTHRWNFGDGSNSTLQNPSKVYNNVRNYNVTYIATNVFGCSDTTLVRDFIRIAPPVVTIIPVVPQGCVPHVSGFSLLKEGPGQISSVQWDFGNGNVFSGLNPPPQTYTDQGVFTVSATVIFSDDCPELIAVAQVSAGSKPSFSGVVNRTEVCVQRPPVVGTASGGNINTVFTWHFGDGTSKEGQTASHEYSDPGQFTVSLVGSNFGCQDSIVIDQVVVNPPSADFRTTNTCGGLNLSFRNISIGNTTSEWDFGDGTKLVDNSNTVTHSFPALGTYKVKLTVTNAASGCTNFVEKEIVIDNLRPQLKVPVQRGCAPFLVSVEDTTANFKTIVWDLGDTTITAKRFQRLYPNPGQYSIKAYTVDDAGCRDTFNFPNVIRVIELLPDFSFNPPGGCAPISVSFQDASQSQFSTINSFNWDFAGLGTSTQRNPSFTFNFNDSMVVKLAVRDNIGCSAIIEKVVPVSIPVAEFSSELTSICTDVSFALISEATGVELKYFWDFGDGRSISTEQDASVVYTETGIYDISLWVEDANQCRDSIVKRAYVTVENFVYDFDADPKFKTCPELLTNFWLTPSDITYNYAYWDFGNGNQSLDSSRFPTNIYVESGKFDVKLYLEDYRGCRDTVEKKEFIEVRGPRGSFTFAPDSGCAPLEVVFTGTFANSKENFWDFGDGRGVFDFELRNSITHVYTEGGTATPSLVLDDGLGCRVLIEGTPIRVSGAAAVIEFDKGGLCSGQEATFSDVSTSQNFSPIIDRRWEISDGTILEEPSFTYLFTADSTKTFWVKLLIDTEFGCQSADSVPITVYAYPVIDAGPALSLCQGDQLELSASGAAFYEWLPANVTSNPFIANPSVSPLASTLFSVMGYDTIACPSFDSVFVEVLTRFSGIAGPDTIICQGDSLSLFTEVSAVSSGSFEYRWSPDIYISDSRAANPMIWPDKDITYTVNVRNGNCAELNYPVYISVNPKPSVVAGPDQQIFKGQSVRLSADSPDRVRYSWSPNYNISCLDCPFPIVNPETDFTYLVTVTDQIGCSATDSVNLRIWEACSGENVSLPNTFTPNSDGLNDMFYVRGTGLSNIKLFRIYNRWGEMVFESPDINIGWDGTYNGTPVNSGVYVYYLEAVCLNGDNALIRGNVTVLR